MEDEEFIKEVEKPVYVEVIREVEKRVPYGVIQVELEEGPRLVSNIVDAEGRLKIDMPLELTFRRIGAQGTEDVTPLRFPALVTVTACTNASGWFSVGMSR